jgi:hypothetical protein
MKIPYSITCGECGCECSVELRLDDNDPKFTCPEGHRNYGFFDLDVTIGIKILTRSQHELVTRKDYSMSIVLSAMAFDCELARVFRKWQGIAAFSTGKREMTDLEFEEQYRRLGSVRSRIDAVAALLDARGLEAFASASSRFSNSISTHVPELHFGSLAENFQQCVFWPRNRILHHGFIGYSEFEAQRVFVVAKTGIVLFCEMDDAKRQATWPE